MDYAGKIAHQVKTLLDSWIPASRITVVGASKGAGIAILVSSLLENNDVNFVLLGSCDPVSVEEFIKSGTIMHGNFLSIYDSSDVLAGSCQELFAKSVGKGISNYDELVIEMGKGHGMLYAPYDEWINPTLEWARNP